MSKTSGKSGGSQSSGSVTGSGRRAVLRRGAGVWERLDPARDWRISGGRAPASRRLVRDRVNAWHAGLRQDAIDADWAKLEKDSRELATAHTAAAVRPGLPRIWEHSRVVLRDMGPWRDSFVHASRVSLHNQSYVLAAAPAHTNEVLAFWRLVWQEKIGVIVMMCPHLELRDGHVALCSAEYWPVPEGEALEVGGKDGEALTIRNVAVNRIPDCGDEGRHSRLRLYWRNAVRHIHHIQYSGWRQSADLSLESVEAFQSVAGAMSEAQTRLRAAGLVPTNAPVLIHCSDGLSYSALFLSLLGLVKAFLFGDPAAPNVRAAVLRLREQRAGALASHAHFTFLHAAALHFFHGHRLLSADSPGIAPSRPAKSARASRRSSSNIPSVSDAEIADQDQDKTQPL